MANEMSCQTLSKGRQTNSLLFEILSPKVAQCSEQIQDLSDLRDFIPSWGQGWYNHWGHTAQTILGQLVLGKKWLGAGYKDTFDQSNCVSLPSMNLTPVFARTQGQEENSPEGQCFKEGFQWSLANLCNTRGRFQEGMPFRPLGLSLKTAQEMSKILIVLKFIGELPSCQQ